VYKCSMGKQFDGKGNKKQHLSSGSAFKPRGGPVPDREAAAQILSRKGSQNLTGVCGLPRESQNYISGRVSSSFLSGRWGNKSITFKEPPPSTNVSKHRLRLRVRALQRWFNPAGRGSGRGRWGVGVISNPR